MELNKQQMKKLRAMCHALKPIVRIGQHGFSAAVAKELALALDHHELVKIKIAAEGKAARNAILNEIVEKSNSTVVQTIGGTATLFKRNNTDPVIPLG